MIGSIIAIYWLQPNLPLRYSSYILQTVTVLLTVGTWWLTQNEKAGEAGSAKVKENRISILIIFLLVIGLAFNRYLNLDTQILNYRPPPPLIVAAALGFLGLLFLILGRRLKHWDKHFVLTVAILIIVGLFIVLKTEPVAVRVSFLWRIATNQDYRLASPSDFAWLGFSYVAFRLIHTLRDSQIGNLATAIAARVCHLCLIYPCLPRRSN